MKSIFILFGLSILCFSTVLSQDKNLEVEIKLDKKTYKVGEEITLLFDVTNKSGENYNFCKIQTPFEGFRGSFLKIKHIDTNLELVYVGPMVKRGKPTETDYINIGSSKSIKSALNINSGYKVEEPGTYTIQFIGGFTNKLPDSNIITFEIKE